MIMRRRVGDAEADRDNVKEGGVGQFDATRPEIVAGMENQFVGAGGEHIPDEKRSAVDPAIGVRPHRLEMGATLAFDPVEVDPHRLGRLAGSGIEDVRGKTCHGAGAPMMKGVSKKNSSRLLPGPSRSTTRKSLGASSDISGWCQTLRR